MTSTDQQHNFGLYSTRRVLKSSRLLVFSFSGIGIGIVGTLDRSVRWEFENTFRDTDFSVVYLKEQQPSWFTADDGLDQLLAYLNVVIRELRPDRIAAIGLSMGGFAAIRFAPLLRADSILAFCPQTSWITEEMKAVDNRYRAFFNRGRACDLLDMSISAKTIIFTGDSEWLDLWHANRMIGGPTICVVEGASHDTLAMTIKKHIDFSTLVQRLLLGQETLRELQYISKLVEAANKNYLNEYVAAQVLYRNNDLEGALTSMRNYLNTHSNNKQALIDLGTMCFHDQRYDEARHSFERAHQIDRENLLCIHALIQIAIRMGDASIATHWICKATALDTENIWTKKYQNEAADRFRDASEG